ncbi:MAG: sialidase family protein [Opitutales bacterium]
MVRFKDEWFCVFREGKGHVSPDGALRVIASKNGQDWRSTALLTSDDSDLRDAKINVTPDGRLMLSGAEAMHDRSKYSHQSLTWFSKDGRKWSKAHEVGDRDFWLWRTTWHKGKAYGFGYGTNRRKRSIRLYRSDDGFSFEVLVKNAFDKGYPNETSIVFLPDETALCLLRRDSLPNTAQLGRSKPPYQEWTWKDLGVRIGGPHLVRLPDGRFVTTVRRYDGVVRTSLHWLDPEKATLTEFMKLPSGKDTSYAGLVWHEDMLWVSYYSSHEGKTSIYLAKVKFGN